MHCWHARAAGGRAVGFRYISSVEFSIICLLETLLGLATLRSGFGGRSSTCACNESALLINCGSHALALPPMSLAITERC